MFYKGFYLMSVVNNQLSCRDGSHSEKSGVSRALYLHQHLGLLKEGESPFLFEVKEDVNDLESLTALVINNPGQWEKVTPKAKGVNQESLKTMQRVMKASR